MLEEGGVKPFCTATALLSSTNPVLVMPRPVLAGAPLPLTHAPFKGCGLNVGEPLEFITAAPACQGTAGKGAASPCLGA